MQNMHWMIEKSLRSIHIIGAQDKNENEVSGDSARNNVMFYNLS
jgi:hypothetical protein